MLGHTAHALLCAVMVNLGDRVKFIDWLILKHQVRVLFRPLLENELLDMAVEKFLVLLRFKQRGKLDQLGIEIDFF